MRSRNQRPPRSQKFARFSLGVGAASLSKPRGVVLDVGCDGAVDQLTPFTSDGPPPLSSQRNEAVTATERRTPVREIDDVLDPARKPLAALTLPGGEQLRRPPSARLLWSDQQTQTRPFELCCSTDIDGEHVSVDRGCRRRLDRKSLDIVGNGGE
jgi:hypothetical protein